MSTDASLTADPGVASLIPAQSHTYMEIDHEITSTVILLPSAESFMKGFCRLQAKVCARSTGKLLVQACPGKSVVRWTDRPAITIAVDWGRKATKTNKQIEYYIIWLQVLLETQLDVEKSKVEQEKKKIGLFQEQIRDLVSLHCLGNFNMIV